MDQPVAIVLMGVSGSGKTAVGTRLAEKLQYEFLDADNFHPPANIEKMITAKPSIKRGPMLSWPALRDFASAPITKRSNRDAVGSPIGHCSYRAITGLELKQASHPLRCIVRLGKRSKFLFTAVRIP